LKGLIERLFGYRCSQVPKHLKARVQMLDRLESFTPPPPWRSVAVLSVGGLQDVGFAPSSDLLLATSVNGLGVFDCLAGRRLARDDDQDLEIDAAHLTIVGIGPIEGITIPLAGIHGGGLPAMTADGWNVERYPLAWPDEQLFLSPPGETMLWTPPGKATAITKLAGFISEIRAFGFSPTGKSLVVATSADITVYARN
jgi:hypothetical protein